MPSQGDDGGGVGRGAGQQLLQRVDGAVEGAGVHLHGDAGGEHGQGGLGRDLAPAHAPGQSGQGRCAHGGVGISHPGRGLRRAQVQDAFEAFEGAGLGGHQGPPVEGSPHGTVEGGAEGGVVIGAREPAVVEAVEGASGAEPQGRGAPMDQAPGDEPGQVLHLQVPHRVGRSQPEFRLL